MTPAQFNAWRVVPRILMLMFSLMLWEVFRWFMGLEEPTTQHTVFVSTVAATIPPMLGLYVRSGGAE